MKSFSIVYIGNSMYPTFKSRDIIHYVPYEGRKIRRGDVIVFSFPGKDTKIIHRVVSVDGNGIRTRGDNNSTADNSILSPDQVFGRAISVKRRGRQWRVCGGPMGPWLAVVGMLLDRADKTASPLLRPAYRRLARKGPQRRWLRRLLKTRVVSFVRPGGTELQLLLGNRVIGSWGPGREGWIIRRPFRLLVDEEALPKNLSGASGGHPFHSSL
jgi:hypothetical protein